MQKLKAALAGLAALLAAASASAQQFPTVPDHTVIGRVGTGSASGASQAIPFATLFAQAQISGIGGLLAASQFPTAPGILTPAMLANANASTFFGNPTTSSAAPSFFTPGSLTTKASPVTGDLIVIADSAAGFQLKQASAGSIGTIPGVASIDGQTGVIVGVDLNTLNAVTANYTVATSDCGKTISAGGSTFYTITLPAVGGFSGVCTVNIKNSDTGRAKAMSGFPSDAFGFLWPLQSITVKIINGAWATTQNPGRWRIPTTEELCVRQDGSDANDGLGNGSTAAGCLQHIQTAVARIGIQWDGGGYNACAIGVYPGGTNIINESVSQTGQSMGCYLTLNWRGQSITWTNTGPCWTAGDGSITVFNFNINALYVPILQCNLSNVALTGQFYGHQDVIYDINGSVLWVPGGANDDFVVMDAQGRATLGMVQLQIGDGAVRAANSILNCNYGCRGLQISGAVVFNSNVTISKIFVAKATSLINTTASYSGSPTVAGASVVDGNSVLNLNGTTPPGGAITPTHGGQSF